MPELPGTHEARRLLRWVNGRRSLRSSIRLLREVLPGDPDFGDPLSTPGLDPRKALGRQAFSARAAGPLGALAELGLAVLQVADWVGWESFRGTEGEVAILFTDVVGFSSWALRAGDEASLPALRRIDALVSMVVEDEQGQVVKRLGDGSMSVFPDAPSALAAARRAIERVRRLKLDGLRPQLRAGLHFGTPQPIGHDYVGIDVNIAARLCEAAEGDQVLLSEPVRRRLTADCPEPRPGAPRELDGVPDELTLYWLRVDGDVPADRR